MLNFGTSGLRGLVSDMTDKECYINCRGFITFLLEQHLINPKEVIVIAGDLRPSTPRILLAVAKAIQDAGCEISYAGLCPTPALISYAIQNQLASIMVTGSHIPEDRNGIKFSKPDGEVLKADEPFILTAITKWRQELMTSVYPDWFDEHDQFKHLDLELPAANKAVMESYKRRYLDFFPEKMLAGMRVVVDQHSAVGRDFLPELLKDFGADVIVDGRTDHFVAIDTENVTPEAEARFKALAQKHQPFAIVSTDGDSDRPFILDGEGNFYRGDLVGALVADFLKADFAVLPISSNDAIDGFLKSQNISFIKTQIGSPYVIKAMIEAKENNKKNVVGWEVNGGFMLGSDCVLNHKTITSLPTRDALLPILVILCLAKDKPGLNQLFEPIANRYTQAGLLDDFPTDISQKIISTLSPTNPNVQDVIFGDQTIEIVEKNGQTTKSRVENEPLVEECSFWQSSHLSFSQIKQGLEAYYFTKKRGFASIRAINYTDGIRILFENKDIAHIRPSGNAPQLRMYANCAYQENANRIVKLALEENGLFGQMMKDILAG